MAYVEGSPVSLAGTVSFQPNNLSYFADYACYVRFNDVILVTVESGEARKIPLSSKAAVFQASIEFVASTVFLVVASSEGTQVWSVDGLELKFFLPLNSIPSAENDSHFSRGITSTENGYICTGTSGGNVIVVNVPSRGGEGISFFDSLDTKDCPITAMAASSMLLACANDNGDIYCFDPNEAFLRHCVFDGAGYPCTAIAAKEDVIVAGYSTGHIRAYRFFQREQILEISAHARMITGLCIHHDLFLAVSCSEDQYMHVWSIPDMALLSSNRVENTKLTGVAFLSGDRIGVVGYDDDEMTIFNRSLKSYAPVY